MAFSNSSSTNITSVGIVATVTAIAAAATAGYLLGSARHQRIPSEKPAPIQPKSNGNAEEEAIIKEQLARNTVFLGEDGIDKVRKSFVIVVGVGGVGTVLCLSLSLPFSLFIFSSFLFLF